eukprot:m.70222 g.70222  ORF g.70222 m.70222 type:complete len:229 (-) comp10002_c0_seq2:658-1344(-)
MAAPSDRGGAGPADPTPDQMAQIERSLATGAVPWTPFDIRPWVKQMGGQFKKPSIELLNYPPLPRITMSMQTIEDIGDSCAVRSVIALGGGYVLGGMFGLFFSGLETPGGGVVHMPKHAQPKGGLPATPGQLAFQEQTVKQAMQAVGKQMHRTGRNFAMIGCAFAGTECVIESIRGRTDHSASLQNNSVYAGAIVGSALGFRAGPQAALFGGATFAVFSVVIDHFMRG